MWSRINFKVPQLRTEHDSFCMGNVQFGACDCAMIQRIRDDERRNIPSPDEAYARGYMRGRKDAGKAVKKHLKKFKKSFRKTVASVAVGRS